MGQVLTGVQRMDRDVFDSVAGAENPRMDSFLPRLSDAANYSGLWIGLAGAMAVTRVPQLQRAAMRGLASVAGASLIANQLGKKSLPRDRPGHESVPIARRIRRYPTSSSFPSGHAASAAAFAVGVGREAPKTGVVVSALAGLVGFSRVYTGAHYPSDVLAGWGLGTLIAVLSEKLAPRTTPAQGRRTEPLCVDEPERVDGEGLVLVVNPASGGGNGKRVLDRVKDELPAAEIVALEPEDDVVRVLRDAAQRAEVLGVAGGDGTVATASGVALETEKPLAVFPAGTLNHFAKQIGCATTDRTIAALRRGTVEMVDVVTLNNDTTVINTASIGVYPRFVEVRERYEGKLGKTLAAMIATWQVLKDENSVEIRYDNRTLRTSLFFLGNSLYHPTGFAPVDRACVDDGLIDVRMLENGRPLARVCIVVSLLLGRLDRSPLYHELQRPEFRFEVLGESADAAHDGEVGMTLSEAEFVSHYRVLPVFCPRR